MRSSAYYIKILALLGLLVVFPAHATEPPSMQFEKAVKAFQQGDKNTFSRLEQQLKTHILHPYLRYLSLTEKLPNARQADITRFINAYPDSHMAERLQQQWLQVLAKRQDWQAFLKAYKPTDDVGTHCLYRTALLKTGRTTLAFKNLRSLWETAKTQPPACDAVFAAWRAQGGLSTGLIWKRIRLAMNAGNLDLLNRLSSLLPASQRPILSLWERIHATAQKDPENALQLFHKMRHRFNPYQRGEIARTIGLAFATMGDPRAAKLLSQVPPAAVDRTVREWRVRMAIAQHRWRQARTLIQAMPEEEKKEPIWRYWLARSMEMLNQDARPLYRALAKKPDYYGFLASARLNQPFAYKNTAPRPSPQAIAAIAARPAFKRAYAFYRLNWVTLARQEWQAALRPLSPKQLHAAGQLALQWKWHDRAIVTAAKAKLMDDIELRFPMPFHSHVVTESKRHRLDPSWIFAIMRKESAFMADAKSRAGAMGLMQIMPATAKWLAAKSQQTHTDIFNANKNIRFGSGYLQHLLETYQGSLVLATAAYNSGPGRISRWRNVHANLIADQWIETLPWYETRDYVKQVLAYTAIYDLHLGKSPNLHPWLKKIS